MTSYTGVDKDMTSMHTVKHGEWREDEGDQQGFPSREEGPKLIWFESPRWRPKDNSSSSPLYLRVQEQHAQKMTPMSHTESISDVLYMDGKIVSRSFQWHWFEAQINSESTGIVETSERPESVKLLQHHLLGCWPMYHVGIHDGRG